MKKLFLFLLLALPIVLSAQTTNDDRQNDRFARELNLSNEQEKRWLNLHRSYKAKIANLKADTTLSKTDQKRRLKALHDERRDAQRAILTPEQARQYDTMKAERKTGKKAQKANSESARRVKAAKKNAGAPKQGSDTNRD